jgi:hypothetical protein
MARITGFEPVLTVLESISKNKRLIKSFFYLEDFMTMSLIIKKVEAEKDVVPSFGVYRLYSFVMSMTNNPKIARAIALEFGYTKTDATRAAARYRNYRSNRA